MAHHFSQPLVSGDSNEVFNQPRHIALTVSGKPKKAIHFQIQTCKLLVKEELNKLGIQYIVVDLGVVELFEDIFHEQREMLRQNLLKSWEVI